MASRYFRAQARDYRQAPQGERVLASLVPTMADWQIAREQNWYRIPVPSAPKPMEFGWLAFYQGKKLFGDEAFSIRYRARISACEIFKRGELLPDEVNHPRAGEEYYKLSFDRMEELPRPILSRRQRFIVFIATTLDKLENAEELNDLFHDSPLEDEMWGALKRENLEAERQWHLTARRQNYCLDFAIFCANGKLDIECDGDAWHSEKPQIAGDNARNNALETLGWSVLRFNTKQIREQLDDCLYHVREIVSRSGGILAAQGNTTFPATGREGTKQLGLF